MGPQKALRKAWGPHCFLVIKFCMLILFKRTECIKILFFFWNIGRTWSLSVCSPPNLAFKHLAGQLHFSREGLMLEKKVVSYATYHYSCRTFRQQPRALREPKLYSLFAPQHICLGTRNEPDVLLIQSPKMYKGIWRIRKSTQLLQ